MKKRNKIFTNLNMGTHSEIEYGDFRCCGISYEFSEIAPKLVRLFKLSRNDTISLANIMTALQDGNDN